MSIVAAELAPMTATGIAATPPRRPPRGPGGPGGSGGLGGLLFGQTGTAGVSP
ncbi:hypothetical protein BCGT_0919 [Mycobacterium tuberculosis variant bovis BCG str. ATCC 35743]|nr:hypothetical protein BCGT_0919 [Mycobacterium tuberculosis variant bovis BCG str. ATCC 35743]